jgi:hypothetical protein
MTNALVLVLLLLLRILLRFKGGFFSETFSIKGCLSDNVV